MKRALTSSLLLLHVMLLAQSTYSQQDGRPFVITLPQGGFASFKLEVTPLDSTLSRDKHLGTSPPPFIARVVTGEGNVLHRLVADERGRYVFVYDLVITEFEKPKRFGVSARAVDTVFARSLRADNPAAFQNVSKLDLPTLTQATEQQKVADGGTVALDLLINEPLGIKVVDYVTVASDESLLPSSRPSGPARDFALSNVELGIKNYQLYVDNQLVLTKGRRNCTGAMVWFHLPGRGRFVFSLVPYEGYDFRKIGFIEDNRISFAWKGVSYEWISQEPIVGSGGLWNLWVLHDPDFVDIFAPAETNTKTTEPRLTVGHFPTIATVIIPLPKRDDTITLQSHGSAKPLPEPIRVVIGGAKSIGDLLPKK